MRAPPLAALTLAVACGRDPDPGLSPGTGTTSLAASTGSTGSAGSLETTSSSSGVVEDSAASSSSSGAAPPDMPTPPDFGDVQPAGCKGKIDFLFLIASTFNMKSEQDNLLASLPGFIATIEQTFPDFDVHIMVANPDDAWSGWKCEDMNSCGQYGHCGEHGEDYVCGSWELIGPCDDALGAGLLFNAGPYATNHLCELAGGRRYITLPGEPHPAAAFDCIARVGIAGGWTMGDAIVAAVSPALNDGGCNDGFLREDALLVITTISDTEDEQSKTQPVVWYDAILAAKGDPSSAVMLAITAQPLVGEAQPGCTYNDGYAKIRHLNEMFPFRAEGDICAPSYVPFFEEATELVGEACDSFIPK